MTASLDFANRIHAFRDSQRRMSNSARPTVITKAAAFTTKAPRSPPALIDHDGQLFVVIPKYVVRDHHRPHVVSDASRRQLMKTSRQWNLRATQLDPAGVVVLTGRIPGAGLSLIHI